MDVVVVESPAKAKTINKYLGKDFKVLASYGHVRDLPAKNGSVRPDDDFDMSWEVAEGSEKHIQAIAEALKGASHLYLATDPDREGEAISWHVQEVLDERKALNGVDISRVVFHEVTKDAVLDAIEHPRELNKELVEAYLARRALDYLVGFTLSPILWRKLPGARSAGRVQSVALRLICEREAEIEAFNAQEFWTVEARFRTDDGAEIVARLTQLDGVKLGRMDLKDEASAAKAVEAIRSRDFRVASVERKEVRRNPQPPFTTSTLQQEASRKLGFNARRTMRTAQKLYEGIDIGGETVGLITYMRTDSVNLANEAVTEMRNLIARDFGLQYRPEQPNVYKSKAKNAQEAHEAIRPTDVNRLPKDVASRLGADDAKLYELIWKRAVASAMKNAVLEQVAVDIASPDKAVVLRATGSVVKFDGFLKLYQEGSDDSADQIGQKEQKEQKLPSVAEGAAMATGEVTPEQHFTKPPPRFSEASLVKRLEELGIGRPSTYASIISVLQERNYVRLESRRFIPEDRGRLVTTFLSGFFERYVEYNFTAELENKLDDISNGQIDWRAVLREFWLAFSAVVTDTNLLTVSNVIDALDHELGPHFFQETPENPNPRECPACKTGRLGVKLGRNGGFIGCSGYPECKYTRSLAIEDEAGALAMNGPMEMGVDPETGKMVTMRRGPFGLYLQLGEAEGKEKPKRASIRKNMDPAALTLETALALLSLPREVGAHPESRDMILAGFGRFGPYLRHGEDYYKLTPDDDVLTIGLNRAVTVIAEAPKRVRKEPLKALGEHPEDKKPVEVLDGRYGPYVKHGRTNASLPDTMTVEEITLEDGLKLLEARATKGKGAKKAAKKAPAKKTAAKKPSANKKAPAKKRSTPKKKGARANAPDSTA